MVEHHHEQYMQIEQAQWLVQQLMEDKDRVIEKAKQGRPEEALHYIESGTGQTLMSGILEKMARFDHRKVELLRQTLERTSQDRSFLLNVIVGGGSLALFPLIFALRLLARSITGPLVVLAKTVENRRAGVVPEVKVLDRGDEIGDLTRVMHEMGQQILEYITQIQKSETELRSLNIDLSTSESKYRGIVDHAPFGIFTAKHGRIIFCNHHNWILAGRNPEDREHVARSFSDATSQQVPFESVFRFLHPNGTVHKIFARAIPLQDGEGHDSLYQGFNVDITALEHMQEKLNRAERLATLGQVAAGIAHEIRNPLVGIGSTSSLLMEDLSQDDPRRADLHTILKETRRLDLIVAQIVEYARPRDLVPGSFEISTLIEETVHLVREPLKQKHIQVISSCDSELPIIQADRDQIKQVLLNGIQNAIDALGSEGELRIEVIEESRTGDNGLLINIQDNGKGITANDLAKIFDQFFTTGKRQGTGLGLAICRNIIEAHGGNINAQSQLGGWTVLSIWLPCSLQRHPLPV